MIYISLLHSFLVLWFFQDTFPYRRSKSDGFSKHANVKKKKNPADAPIPIPPKVVAVFPPLPPPVVTVSSSVSLRSPAAATRGPFNHKARWIRKESDTVQKKNKVKDIEDCLYIFFYFIVWHLFSSFTCRKLWLSFLGWNYTIRKHRILPASATFQSLPICDKLEEICLGGPLL